MRLVNSWLARRVVFEPKSKKEKKKKKKKRKGTLQKKDQRFPFDFFFINLRTTRAKSPFSLQALEKY